MRLEKLFMLPFLIILSGFPGLGFSSEKFGSIEDTKYAEILWKTLTTKRMVGKDAIKLKPFFGGAKPHGMILEVSSRILTIEEHTGFIVVKKNYNGPDVTEAKVDQNRSKYIASITVMFQRESGYDPDNQNWFWVKYKPNGDFFTIKIAGRTKALAGRIIKGESGEGNKGCLFCHASAGGGDYIFYPDIKNPNFVR